MPHLKRDPVTMGETRLYLVRHGQTDLNRDRRFRGMSDASLNEGGREEARLAGELLSTTSVSTVFTSPVRRALQTAEIVSGITGAPVVINDGITDVDYGDWQGLTVEEVAERYGPAALDGWKNTPGDFAFPGGDEMSEVRIRVEACLNDLVSACEGNAIAAVTHMALLKVCFVALLGLGYEYFWRVGIDNGSVSCFTHDPERGFVLRNWNIVPENLGKEHQG